MKILLVHLCFLASTFFALLSCGDEETLTKEEYADAYGIFICDRGYNCTDSNFNTSWYTDQQDCEKKEASKTLSKDLNNKEKPCEYKDGWAYVCMECLKKITCDEFVKDEWVDCEAKCAPVCEN